MINIIIWIWITIISFLSWSLGEICSNTKSNQSIIDFTQNNNINRLTTTFGVQVVNTGNLATFVLKNDSLAFSASSPSSVLRIPLNNCSESLSLSITYYQILEVRVKGPLPLTLNMTVRAETCDTNYYYDFIAKTSDFYPDFDETQSFNPESSTAWFPIALFEPAIPKLDQISAISFSFISPTNTEIQLQSVSFVKISTFCTNNDYNLDDAKSKGFVWKKGNSLMLYDKPFRFISFHATDLIPSASQDSIIDTFKTYSIFANGTNLVTKIYGIYEVCDDCFVKRDGSYNDYGFQRVDTLVHTAKQFGIKVFISLISLSSILVSTGFMQCDVTGKDAFYMSRTCVNFFRKMIKDLVDRVNPKTGIRYGDEPTIIGWQLGQDLSSLEASNFYSASWIAEISQFIKQLAPYHLIMDGGTAIDTGKFWPYNLLSIPTIDIFAHNYNFGATIGAHNPYLPSKRCKRAALLSALHGKAFIVSELHVSIRQNNLERFQDCIDECFFGTPVAVSEAVAPFQQNIDFIHSGNYSLATGVFVYNMLHRSDSKFREARGLYYPGFDRPVPDGKAVMNFVRQMALLLDKRVRLGYENITSNNVTRYIIPKLDPPKITSISNQNWETTIRFFGSIGATFYKLKRFTVMGSTTVLKNTSSLTFTETTRDITEFDVDPPYDDLSLLIQSPYDKCPWVIYYQFYACNDEGSLCSDPALTSITLPGDSQFNETICRPKKTTTTMFRTFSTSQATILGLNDNSILSIPLVGILAGVALTSISVTAFSLYYCFIVKSNRKRMKRASIHDNSNTLHNTASIFSHTINLTQLQKDNLSVPGHLKIDINSLDLLSVEGRGLTSTIISGVFLDKSLASKYGKIAVKLLFFRGVDTGRGLMQDKLFDFMDVGMIKSDAWMSKWEESELDSNFLFEVALMASLPRHPNLVELLGYCHSTDDDSKYSIKALVMKRYKCSLKDLIYNQTFKFDGDTLYKVFHDTASGLDVLHRSNVLHLDFKPHNVLMQIEGPAGNGDDDDGAWIFNCVITDFGFANVINTDYGDGKSQTLLNDRDKLEQQRRKLLVRGLKEPTQAGLTIRYAGK